MNLLRSVAKAFIPFQIRRFLRGPDRKMVFQRALDRYSEDPASCTTVDSSILKDLIYGWGNEGWSASPEYLAACVDHALVTSGPTFECGCGLSTFLLGRIAQVRQSTHWALEHRPEWKRIVQKELEASGIESVSLDARPLKDFGEYSWYDAPLQSMPTAFSFVACDGPPSDTKGGRFGLLPVMREHLAPGCVILLDDADRPKEHEAAARWELDFGCTSELLGFQTPFRRFTVPMADSLTPPKSDWAAAE